MSRSQTSALVFGEQGAKAVVRGKRAVVSTDCAIVTDTALRVIAEGGNAADAAVAACLVQAVVEPFMTNHAGSVVMLYWDASSRRLHALNSTGTLLPGAAPFRPVPAGTGGYAFAGQAPPLACLPGFMPGLKAIYDRFCTAKWATLCEDAVTWAETGHAVSSFEYCVNLYAQPFITYFPEGRAHFDTGGFLTPVGTVVRAPGLARTMANLAEEGPDYFISGGWAKAFVATANAMGWPVRVEDLGANPPRWGEPLIYSVRGQQIAQFGPPEQQGVFCALVLGILSELGIEEFGASSPQSLFYMAHCIRWATQQMGRLHDPQGFATPTDVWLDPEFHRHAARRIRGVMPRVDLTEHVRLTTSPAMRHSVGLPGQFQASSSPQPSGSCELAIVDRDGNWVQMMNTLQSGGIPGVVVEGVPMVGSHAEMGDISGGFSGWLAPGLRLRLPLASTMLLRDGEPVLSTGSPGNVHCTPPQVLSNLIHHKMAPDLAADAPRMLPLGSDMSLPLETRFSTEAISGLAALGVRVASLGDYDWHMGSYQTAWRDLATGTMCAHADTRRCGVADGLEA